MDEDSGVGVGCRGWTDIDEKETGADMWHYTTARAWCNEQHWDSERGSGYGRVSASTGDVGHGAMADISIYYGW